MTSFRNEETAQSAVPAVTYWLASSRRWERLFWPKPAFLAKAGFSGQKKEPAKAGVSRLFPGRKGAGLRRLKPASFRGAQREQEAGSAGVSRLLFARKPALSAKEAGFLAEKEPAFGQKAGSFREEAG